MNQSVFTVGSATFAMKAKRILFRAGIRATVVHVDAKQSRYGCIHGIAFDTAAYYDVIRLLKENGIPYAPYPSTPETGS